MRWIEQDVRTRYEHERDEVRYERTGAWIWAVIFPVVSAITVFLAYAHPGSMDGTSALIAAGFMSVAMLFSVALAVSAGRRLRTIRPQPPSVWVTSTLDGDDTVVREVHVGRRGWLERHALPEDEDVVAAAARHLVEDAHVQAELVAGRLPEITEEIEETRRDQVLSLLESGPGRMARPVDIGLASAEAYELTAWGETRSAAS